MWTSSCSVVETVDQVPQTGPSWTLSQQSSFLAAHQLGELLLAQGPGPGPGPGLRNHT